MTKALDLVKDAVKEGSDGERAKKTSAAFKCLDQCLEAKVEQARFFAKVFVWWAKKEGSAVKGSFYSQRERHVSEDVVEDLTNQTRLFTPCPVC